jgi:hypothetical protein
MLIINGLETVDTVTVIGWLLSLHWQTYIHCLYSAIGPDATFLPDVMDMLFSLILRALWFWILVRRRCALNHVQCGRSQFLQGHFTTGNVSWIINLRCFKDCWIEIGHDKFLPQFPRSLLIATLLFEYINCTVENVSFYTRIYNIELIEPFTNIALWNWSNQHTSLSIMVVTTNILFVFRLLYNNSVRSVKLHRTPWIKWLAIYLQQLWNYCGRGHDLFKELSNDFFH